MNEKMDPEDPRLVRIHAQRLITRDTDQLLGICELSLQDGHIDQYEAEAILVWLNNHKTCLNTWPANIVYDRLREILADGRLDDDEQRDLLTLVMSIARPRTDQGTITPTALPLDAPAPPLVFDNRMFCFTGVFDFGPRAKCIEATAGKGGIAATSITKKLHYLVIGSVGSEVWKHTSFGTKIIKAVDYRTAGYPIKIVDEKHWANHLL